MRALLELKDRIKYYYRQYEFAILPALKFMLAYLAICCVNGCLGYMPQIDKVGVVLVASLLCSFMPLGCILFVASLFSLLHMYALSMEVALVGICIFMILLMMFVRFDSKHSIIIVLTAILAGMNIPYVIPIAVGLLASPMAAVSVGCGLVSHALLSGISKNAAVINGMGSGEEMAKVRLVLDGLLKNREMVVMIVAFAVTIAVVYMIRRMSVDYSWTIAMVAGAIVNLVVILVGDLIYDTQVSLFGVFLASILALVIGKVFEFMFFCVDYSRTENVQFEDDEYFYYVKAVPKMTVAVQSKTVKKINSQQRSASNRSASGRNVQRSVTTEHTGVRRSVPQRNMNVKNTVTGSRTMTIGNADDDYIFEELD
jgi:hypothetical protein